MEYHTLDVDLMIKIPKDVVEKRKRKLLTNTLLIGDGKIEYDVLTELFGEDIAEIIEEYSDFSVDWIKAENLEKE